MTNTQTQTKRVRVLDLVGQDVSGMRMQVRGDAHPCQGWRPAWRTLTVVETETVRGMDFVTVRWVKEDGLKDMGRVDCGYSGRPIDIADDWTMEVA